MASQQTPPAAPRDQPDELDQFLANLSLNASAYQSKEDPPVWEYGNPFVDIWNPSKDPSKFGFYETPLSKATNGFYNLNKDELIRFQELAFQAGLYGPSAERGDIRFGARDPDTYSIWAELQKNAARYHAAGKKNTLWDVLQDLVDNRPENLKSEQKKKRAPLITELPDPREIEELVRGVGSEVLGRDVDEAFTQDFIAMYTKMVSEFQANKYALEGTEEGGTITAPPSPEALAAFRLRYERPEQFEEKRAAERQAAYTSLLKGAL